MTRRPTGASPNQPIFHTDFPYCGTQKLLITEDGRRACDESCGRKIRKVKPLSFQINGDGPATGACGRQFLKRKGNFLPEFLISYNHNPILLHFLSIFSTPLHLLIPLISFSINFLFSLNLILIILWLLLIFNSKILIFLLKG